VIATQHWRTLQYWRSDVGQDRDPVATLVDIHVYSRTCVEIDFDAHFDPARFIVPVSFDGVDGDLEVPRRGLCVYELRRDRSCADRAVKLPARKGRSYEKRPCLGLLLIGVNRNKDAGCSGDVNNRFASSGPATTASRTCSPVVLAAGIALAPRGFDIGKRLSMRVPGAIYYAKRIAPHFTRCSILNSSS
jgi:hypothetical protein